MRTLLGGLAAAFAIFFLSAAPASADTISCPLSQARRTISNDLPAGWWTTPIVSNLSDTRVQTIGGQPALMCVYGESGSIQRQAPPNQTCTAQTGGFSCTPRIHILPVPIPIPTPTPAAPSTHSTGPLQVPQTFMADLDEGAIGASGDIWFHAVTPTELYIQPRGGAQMAVGDRSNRGFAGCSSATYSSAQVPLSDIPVGSYVCVRTNQNHISQFRMNAISAGSPKTLSLGYTTWN